MARAEHPLVFFQRGRPLLARRQHVALADPGDDVLRRHGHGALQQSVGRAPIGQLEARPPREGGRRADRQSHHRPARACPRTARPQAGPQDARPHGRQIGKPVAEPFRGARPRQADGRHQHPQDPQQAHQEFRMAAAVAPGERQARAPPGHRNEEKAQMERGRRIENGQIRRPDRLAEIRQVVSGNQEKAHPQRRHVHAHVLHRPGHEPGDVAKPERRNPERPLFPDEPERSGPGPVEPPQRPDVQQQQDKRRRDQRARLRQHGERQARRARRIFPALLFAPVRIEPQTEQKEKSAERALPLGDPGHAFHA